MKAQALSNEWLQQIVCLLLYRLGGQQTFTLEEIVAIENTIGGVTMMHDKDNCLILRCRTEDAIAGIPLPLTSSNTAHS